MEEEQLPHVAVILGAGMGQLMQSLRLAASLVGGGHKCRLTVITHHPTVSLAESNLISRFLSAFPQVTVKEFHLPPLDNDDPLLTASNNIDPFFLQWETIRRSAHHLLSSASSSISPPISAIIVDITLASAFIPVASALRISVYILFVSCAKMLSLCASSPYTTLGHAKTEQDIDDEIGIPGLPPIPKSWVPLPLLTPTSLFATQFVDNGRKMIESNGIIINTFENLEADTLAALNSGKVVKGLPPVIPVGPLTPWDFERSSSEGELGLSSLSSSAAMAMAWLDEQPKGSVVFVCFGNRSAMSREQIKELGEGLMKSGHRFLWVVKDKKVDKEDKEEIQEVLGKELVEKITKGMRGLVVKSWVDQEAVLSHGAVSGFLSHAGWNSVTEAAWHGVPILAWAAEGDQKIIAEVVERSGWGVWEKGWEWGEKAEIVKGDVIGRKIKEMMENEGLKVRMAQVREEARRAQGVGGCAEKGLKMLLGMIMTDNKKQQKSTGDS